MSANRKRFLLILLYLAAMLPWIVQGARRAMETSANSPIDWVSPRFPARQEYDRFQSQFGAGDVLVVSWPGCRVDERQVDVVVAVLQQGEYFFDDDQRSYFERVSSGRAVLRQLTGPPFSLSANEALQRLEGYLVGGDQRSTGVVVTFRSEAVELRRRLVPIIRRVIEKVTGTAADEIHMAGPIMDGLAVDEAGRATLRHYAPLSAVLVLVLCWISIGSIPAALLVFGLSVLCQGITLAIIDACGDTMSALLIVMPPLIQVLAVASGIHLVNYYFDAAEHSEPEHAVTMAWQMGWLPCSLSAATTAIGLGSLLVSGLVPVRAFGGYAATGVLATLAVTLSCIPGVLVFYPLKLPRRRSVGGGRDRFWVRWVRMIQRSHLLIAATGLVLMVGAGYGVTRLRTSVHIETLFADDSRILRDYAWFEQHLGKLVPIEVVLHCDPDCTLSLEERVELLRRLQSRTAELPSVGAIFSACSFLPAAVNAQAVPLSSHSVPPPPQPLPPPGRTPESMGLASAADQFRAELMETGYFAMSPQDDGEQWRLTAMVSALDNIDYGRFLDALRRHLEPELSGPSGGQLSGVELRLTGIMPLVHSIQSQLLTDLFASFLTAFGVIAVVMTLVQAGLAAGLLAMVSNLFPAVVVFGLLGWRQLPMDIGSVMTASVAVGIAVDDTLHFLTFFQRQLSVTQDRAQAVLSACRHCGLAMIQTSVACGLGLLVFACSEFVPTSRFAWMMLALMWLALLGDLLVLPALLIGPLGKVFEPLTDSHGVPAEDRAP